jgi:hypothetical protein
MNSNQMTFEEMIDRLDAGRSEGVNAQVAADHALILSSVSALAEQDFLINLNKIHKEMVTKKQTKVRMLWIAAIAASLSGAFFLWNSNNAEKSFPVIQMNEMPVYSDSASYDSIKNIAPAVDKDENAESIEK